MKNFWICVCFLLTACAVGGSSGGSASSVPEEEGNSDSIVSFSAWVSSTGAEITFPESLNGRYKFYRSREENCDLDNYSLCSQGQVDDVDGSKATINDSALTLTQPAYYTLQDTVNNRSVSKMISASSFPVRDDHQVVTFNNKMYLIGGYDGSRKNDVWSSTDGIHWIEETANAAFSARYGHQVVVFNNKMFLIGGSYKNDVWSSTDGIHWTQETANAAFSARYRYGHQVVVFNNKMFLIGGSDDSKKNDVWSSTDGSNWIEETANAAFSARYAHRVVVFNNKMFLIGGSDGSYKNDVWSSTDGIHWIEGRKGKCRIFSTR